MTKVKKVFFLVLVIIQKLINCIITKKIIISRDVVFDEEKTWFWSSNTDGQQVPADFEIENEDETKHQAPTSPLLSILKMNLP